ncbi:histidine kinase [Aerococcaceae bacterium NML190938]|nr:histidine kinase [Aerococcaceae bacterium NML190938]
MVKRSINLIHSILKPLALSLILLSVTVLTTTALYIQSTITPDILQLTDALLATKVQSVDTWLAHHIASIEQLCQLLDEEDFTQSNANNLISQLTKQQQLAPNTYDSLGFITPEGYKFLTTGEHFDVQHRDYFTQLKDSQQSSIVSSIISSKADNRQLILIVSKVTQQGEVKGYISAALPLTYIEQIFAQSNDVTRMTLIDNRAQQTIIASAPSEEHLLSVSQPIPSNPNWSATIAVSHQHVFGNISRLMPLLISDLLCFIVAIFIIVKRRIAPINRSLSVLQKGMAQISHNQYHPIDDFSRIVEINQIEHGYNQLLHDIQAQQRTIKKEQLLTFEAENKALYAQIKPHFLYNTLETIQAMADDADNEAVVEAVSALARFYRIGLSDDQQLIPLAQELSHALSFVQIMALRYDNLFDLVVDNQVKEELFFLKFTIQPLVENAIYHGIKLADTRGRLHINIYSEHNKLYVQVHNQPTRLSDDDVAQLNQHLQHHKLSGYGLYNVNARLRNYFGEHYGVTLIKQDDTFISQVVHPIIKHKENTYEYLSSR